MHVILKPSPSVTHRYRVTLPCKRSIDFGKNGVDYYVARGPRGAACIADSNEGT